MPAELKKSNKRYGVSKGRSTRWDGTPLTEEQRKLVADNMRLAGHMANALKDRYPLMERDDMVSSAYEGMIFAARRYDPNHHSKAAFSTMACRWIGAWIQREYYKTFLIHIPYHRLSNCRENAIGTRNSIDCQESTVRVLSLRRAWGVDCDLVLATTESKAPDFYDDEVEHLISEISKLPETMSEIVMASCIRCETLRSIGDRLNISYEWVRIIRDRGIDFLRHRMTKEKAKSNEGRINA